MGNYFDKDGSLITLDEWAHKFEDFEYKSIGADVVGPWNVSTVWLGLDHSFGEPGGPLIFESMVFPDGEWSDVDMNRYATLEDAKAGHVALVEKWKHIPAHPEPDPED